MRGLIADLRVTPSSGVVHDPDCRYVSGPRSIRWIADDWAAPMASDRACSVCLPDGLPGGAS